MKKIIWLLMGLMLSHCPISLAANKANQGAVTVGGNGLFFAHKRYLDNSAGFFISASYNFTQNWSIEGLLAQINSQTKASLNYPHSADGVLSLVDILYHFPVLPNLNSLQPYALAGAGIMGLGYNRQDAKNEGVINAGLGLQWFLDEVVSFKADVRDVYTMVGSKNDIYLSGGVAFSFL